MSGLREWWWDGTVVMWEGHGGPWVAVQGVMGGMPGGP